MEYVKFQPRGVALAASAWIFSRFIRLIKPQNPNPHNHRQFYSVVLSEKMES